MRYDKKNLPWSPRIPVQKAVLDKLPAGSIIQFESIHGICPTRKGKDLQKQLDACLFISKARSLFWCSNDLDVGLSAALGLFSHNPNMLPPCYTISSFTLHMVF